MFDGFILSSKYDIHPAFLLDTLSMARAAVGHHVPLDLDALAKLLGVGGKIEGELIKTKDKRTLTEHELEQLGHYCNNDVEVTYRVFEKLLNYVPDDELELIDMTLRMFTSPVLRLNRPRVVFEKEKHLAQKEWLVSKTGSDATALRSTPQFCRLLEEAGATVPLKISKSTGMQAPALAKTDPGFKRLMREGSERVRDLCAARMRVASSLSTTRPQRLLDVTRNRRPLPVGLLYSGAHTHRWSGTNKMNMQNLERGGELRKAIVAPPGHVLVVADSAQIEARFTAWFAGQHDLVEAFRTGRDIYSEFASKIYKRTIDRKRQDPDGTYPDFNEGFVGKACILGLGFGMGSPRLQDTLMLGTNGPEVPMALGECQHIIDIYRSQYLAIPKLWSTMDEVLRRMANGIAGTYMCITYGKEFIRLPNGMFLRYPELRCRLDELGRVKYQYKTRRGFVDIWGGTLTENIIQALARCAIAENMLVINRKYRIAMMTHDEIVCLAKKAEGKTAYEFALKVMATTPTWAPGLPLKAEGGYARNYSK